MSRLRLVPILVAALLAAAPAFAGAWLTYANGRFGTTADVPADWKRGKPPENGDGLTFTSPDKRARITVSGSLQVMDTIEDTVAILDAPNDGETITYRHKEPGVVVVSGTVGKRIFYRKSILSCRDTIWNSVAIEYPKAEKEAYDAIVTHVAGSLRAGSGWQAENCDGSAGTGK